MPKVGPWAWREGSKVPSWTTGLDVRPSVALGEMVVWDPAGSPVAEATSSGKLEVVGDGESSPSEDESLSDSSSGTSTSTGGEIAGADVAAGGVATGSDASGDAVTGGGSATDGTSCSGASISGASSSGGGGGCGCSRPWRISRDLGFVLRVMPRRSVRLRRSVSKMSEETRRHSHIPLGKPQTQRVFHHLQAQEGPRRSCRAIHVGIVAGVGVGEPVSHFEKGSRPDAGRTKDERKQRPSLV